mmetsp:Transcript_3637/g.12216  ORF Transcript_3637/g.12216 Transcript_3637/m.12216 type:complete len:213 (-) Transcript_3637:52-690(-)
MTDRWWSGVAHCSLVVSQAATSAWPLRVAIPRAVLSSPITVAVREAPYELRSWTVERCPLSMARKRGERPMRSAWSTAAPAAHSTETTSVWPSSLARSIAVSPSLFAKLTAAPAEHSTETVSVWPSSLARMRDVDPLPSAVVWSMASPAASSVRTSSDRPWRAALSRGESSPSSPSSPSSLSPNSTGSLPPSRSSVFTSAESASVSSYIYVC